MAEINAWSPETGFQHRPPEHNKKHFHWAIFIVVVLAVAALAVIYVEKFKTEEDVAVLESALQSPPMDKEDYSFKDWKTYRNEEYGFEFRYPQGYEVSVTPSGVIEIAEPQPENLDHEYGGIWLYFYSDAENITLLEWWKKQKEYNLSDRIEQVDISNKPALKIVSTEGMGEKRVIFKIDKYILEILKVGFSDSVFDNIVSTFKFIDHIDTSDWKTYRNQEYGFQFRYPDFDNLVMIEKRSGGDRVTINFENFTFQIFKNKDLLTLDKWFEKNIDKNNILISSGTFLKGDLNGNDALFMTGGVPLGWNDGPIATSMFIIFPSKEYILSFSINGPDTELQSNGYVDPGGYEKFQDHIISTLKFSK